jgi:hypothetical protein
VRANSRSQIDKLCLIPRWLGCASPWARGSGAQHFLTHDPVYLSAALALKIASVVPLSQHPWRVATGTAYVVALLWSAMQITGDDASRELGRAVAWLRPSG